jgi:hypothetical protein
MKYFYLLFSNLFSMDEGDSSFIPLKRDSIGMTCQFGGHWVVKKRRFAATMWGKKYSIFESPLFPPQKSFPLILSFRGGAEESPSMI